MNCLYPLIIVILSTITPYEQGYQAGYQAVENIVQDRLSSIEQAERDLEEVGMETPEPIIPLLPPIEPVKPIKPIIETEKKCSNGKCVPSVPTRRYRTGIFGRKWYY